MEAVSEFLGFTSNLDFKLLTDDIVFFCSLSLLQDLPNYGKG